MRAKFAFKYGQALTPEVVDALNRAGIEPILVMEEDGRVPIFGNYTGDLRKVMAVLPVDVALEIQGVADPRPLLELSDAVRALELRLAGRPANPSSYVNNRVEVHVPGNALLAVEQVEVFPDLCTEELNELLEKGWRIVAVCPQPDQRRPDYVLGRRKPLDDALDSELARDETF